MPELGSDAEGSGDATQVALVCGDLGAGKTSVGRAMSELLTAVGIRHGVVDLDALCQLHPSDDDYRDSYALKWENFAAIWPRFVAFGARYGIASGSLYGSGDRQRLAAMLGPQVKLRARSRVRQSGVRRSAIAFPADHRTGAGTVSAPPVNRSRE